MMRSRPLAVSLAAAAVAAQAACGTEADVTPAGASHPASRPPPAERDAAWMRTAHRANLAEIDAGRIAQRKGGTPEIRTLGTMLVRDHGTLDAKLTAAAGRLGVELPYAPSGRQLLKADELKDASGRLFDIHWITAMAAAHEKAVAAARAEIATGTTPAVRTLAKSALPVLEGHLVRIEAAEG